MKRNLPKYVYPKGKKGYLYFTRNGRTTRMVEQPGTDAFFLEYARLLNGAPPVPRGKTWQSLIAAYKSSPKYTEKAKRTRSDYDKILSFIIDKMGQMDPVKMRRKDVIRIRDANAETKRFANYCVQIIGILQEYAIDIGWRDEGTNPAKGVSLLKSESTREPWPQEMVEAYRAKATGRALLLFELMIGTGQRIGDVLQMQWGMIENDAIVLRQNKTGKSLYIPFTHRLRSLLAETPREALFIVPGKDGKPLSYRAAARPSCASARPLAPRDGTTMPSATPRPRSSYWPAAQMNRSLPSPDSLQRWSVITPARPVKRFMPWRRRKGEPNENPHHNP